MPQNQTLAPAKQVNYAHVDSVADIFGKLHRVWKGTQLLGTFYQSLECKWIAQISLPDFSIKKVTCNSRQEAIAAISN